MKSGVFPHDTPYTNFTLEQQTSTNSWVTLDEAIEVQQFQEKLLRLSHENVNGNSVDFRVLGSVDYGDNYDVTLKSSTTLTAGSNNTTRIPEAVSHLKVEIQSTTTDTPDDVSGKMGAFSPAG